MFRGELPLLTAFHGPEALKAHFQCIYDGLLFRRFRSQVPGDPKKIAGGVRELLGARLATFRLQRGRYAHHCVSGEASDSLKGPLKKRT